MITPCAPSRCTSARLSEHTFAALRLRSNGVGDVDTHCQLVRYSVHSDEADVAIDLALRGTQLGIVTEDLYVPRNMLIYTPLSPSSSSSSASGWSCALISVRDFAAKGALISFSVDAPAGTVPLEPLLTTEGALFLFANQKNGGFSTVLVSFNGGNATQRAVAASPLIRNPQAQVKSGTHSCWLSLSPSLYSK